MPDFALSFFDHFSGGLIALTLYGLCFFAILKFVEEGSNSQPDKKKKNFTTAAPKKPFFHKDFKLELSYYLFNLLITDLLGKMLVVLLTVYVLNAYFPFQLFADAIQSWPFALQVFTGLLIADAAFFVPHLIQHKVFWPVHSIHHSAEELTWITALRLHPFDHLAFIIGGALALYIFGFEGKGIAAAILIHSSYNLFVHANLNLEYPKPLCYILGSPNYHRWHHATDKVAIDKNMATMFPVFDLICGTYYHPRGELPKAYGVYGKAVREAYPKTFAGQLLHPLKGLWKKKKVVRDDGIEPPTHSV